MIDVQGVVQVKVSGYSEDDNHILQQDDNAIRLAAQHFIGTSDDALISAVTATMEGHQRAILGTLTVEELSSDRKAFSEQVRKLADDDMRSMGLAIVSYTITSITDSKGYMQSLGVAQAAQVARTAEESKAFHGAETTVRAQQEHLKETVARNQAAMKQAELEVELALVQAANMVKVNEAEVRAAVAQELEQAMLRQKVVAAQAEQQRLQAEFDVKVQRHHCNKRKMEIELEAEAKASADIIRANKEAQSLRIELEKEHTAVELQKQHMQKESVRISATADMNCAAMLQEAQNQAARTELRAEAALKEKQKEAEGLLAYSVAEADAARAKGLADVEVLKAKKAVEAEALRETAEAYSNYGEAALRMEALKTMPLVAEQISKPLQNTGKIVFMGGNGAGAHAQSAGSGPSVMLRDMVSSMNVVNEALDTMEGTHASKLIGQVADHPYALQAVVRGAH